MFVIKFFCCFEFFNDRICFFLFEIMVLWEVIILDFLGVLGDKKVCFFFFFRGRIKERSVKMYINFILMLCDVYVFD